MNIQDKIKQQIADNNIVLYMKGNAELPMCGFSARAVNLLKSCGAPFTTIDVLQDEDVRHGIKVYSNWPTIPQLYIKGEFIGGSDIMAEMYEAGELQQLIKSMQE
ncbi:MAG: Grx4 family monothiol glutaredoxin [Gammaproteobacteria bacterium]|nr:Grx4 family monothiol glutaredoxin [Gammaproteobacteria bacterium]MCW5583738.1 Grx4 family monothiol glutaredoxin [Gammaproteobacteria bacterium]